MLKLNLIVLAFVLSAFNVFSLEIGGSRSKDILTFYQLQKKAKSLKKDDGYVVEKMMNYYLETSDKDSKAQTMRLVNNSLFFEQTNYEFVLHATVAIKFLLTSNDRLLLMPVITKLESKLNQIKDSDELKTTEFLILTYYQFIGDFGKSRKHGEVALNLSEKLKDTVSIQMAHFNLAVLDYYEKKYSKARVSLNKALYFEKFGFTQGHYNKIQLLSAIEFAEGNTGKALEILQNLEPFVTEENKGMYYANLGEIQLAHSFWNEAIVSLKKAEAILVKVNSVGLFNVYSNLAVCYSKVRDFENSYKYELLKNEIIKKEQKQEALLSIEKRKQIDLKRIQSIEKCKSLEKEKANQSKANVLSGVLSVVFLSLLASIVVLLRVNKKNRELVRESLQKMNIAKESKAAFTADYSESELIEKKISPLLVEKFEKAFYDKELFKDPDLTIQKLAKKIGTNVKDLSQTINGHYNVPFRNLVNEKRVELAKELLIDKRYENYSMEGIAETVGYKNKSMFYLHFKNLTGVTPASFQSHAVKLLKNNPSIQLENSTI